MDEIAGKRGSFGAVGAPDRPDRGLLTDESAHCDGGDHLDVPGYPQSAGQARERLAACRAFIFAALRSAVEAAGAIADDRGRIDSAQIPSFFSCVYNGSPGRAKCNALEALGLAFHAAQDFYSHSNWADLAAAGPTGPANPSGLGNEGRAPWLDPAVDAAAPPGLISGCFEGVPESAFCRYGNGQARVRHENLNKDTGAIDPAAGTIGAGTTTRGQLNTNFARAVSAAIDDTRAKWAYFENRVLATYGGARGTAIVCAMRNDSEDSCR